MNKNLRKPIWAASTLAKGEGGATGDWRSHRPVLNKEKCTVVLRNKPVCHLCWLYCPEIVISRTIPPEIDLLYCKGCGICAKECPVDAISMELEEKD